MTVEQVALLKLGIAPVNDRTCLLVESALDWVLDNTTLEFDINSDYDLRNLPSNVKLFAIKYIDIMAMTAGVTSESIEGLSQSFDSTDKSAQIWQFANELLNKWLVGNVRFVAAQKRW